MKPQWPAALLAALLPAVALAAPSIPDILPEDSFVVFGSPSTTDLREGFERSPIHALWEDDEFHAFVAPLVDQISTAFADQAGDPLIDSEELFDLFPGQLYVGIMRLSAINGMPDAAPFFAAETSRPQRVIELLDELFEASGAAQSRDTYSVRDVTVARNALRFTQSVTLPGEPSDEPGLELASNARVVTVHTAVTDGLVFVSVDEDLEAVINNLRGGGDGGFAQSESLRGTSALAGDPEGELFFHLNPVVFDELLASTAPPNVPINLAALGLGDFRGMTMWLDYTDDATESWFALSTAPNPAGLGRLLTRAGTGDFAALDWVPSEAMSLSATHIDLAGAYTDLKQIVLAAFPPAAFFITSTLVTLNQTLGFDVENDLLLALGDEVISYTVLNEASGDGPFSAPTRDVFMLGLSAPERVEGALAQLAQPAVVGATSVGGSGMLEANEYLGQTFYTPPAVFNDPSVQSVLPAFAVVGDHLMFSTSADEMRSLIAASQGQIESSIRQSPLWEEVEPLLGEGVSGLRCQDDAAIMAVVAETLQQMSLFFMMMETPVPLDFMSLPGREVFERHLTRTVTSTRITEAGLVSRGRTPHQD